MWNQKVMGVSEQGCRGGQVGFSEQVEIKVIKVTRQSGWGEVAVHTGKAVPA